MSSPDVHAAIRAHLEANWTTTRLAFENEDFDKPKPPAAFVAVEVTGNLYAQASIGAGAASANLWREAGTLWLYVFVPTLTGSAVARTYAKTLADLFRGLELAGGLRFRDASIGGGQAGSEDGNYWGLVVSIDWQKDY